MLCQQNARDYIQYIYAICVPCGCHMTADTAQPRKRSNVTRPFPFVGGVSGNETNRHMVFSDLRPDVLIDAHVAIRTWLFRETFALFARHGLLGRGEGQSVLHRLPSLLQSVINHVRALQYIRVMIPSQKVEIAMFHLSTISHCMLTTLALYST